MIIKEGKRFKEQHGAAKVNYKIVKEDGIVSIKAEKK